MVLNALHSKNSVRLPFKFPVICNSDSSEIHIEYRQKSRILLKSLPVYQGKTADPALYSRQLCQGFQEAYMIFLSNKEMLLNAIKGFFTGKSRYLVRHTQQYHMYLISSFFPELLKSSDKRRLFLHVLDRNAPVPFLLPYERDSLFQMDVPIFFIQGNKTALSDGHRNEYSDYLEKMPKDNWIKKLENVCMQDMELQLSFIECSLETLKERSYTSMKDDNADLEKDAFGFIERAERQIDTIAAQICSMAFISKNGDIGFCIPHIKGTGACSFEPAGPYLYDGLGGIAIFLSAVLKYNRCSLYADIWRLIVDKLFQYTENVFRADKPGTDTLQTGAFEGEGSLISTYLVLYKITGDRSFLDYAEKHAEMVRRNWKKDTCMDFLSGLSGAVTVFGELYQITGEAVYLDQAVRMGEQIWRNCETINDGTGWRIKDDVPPLAGLAHGNSGLLLANGVLLEHTGNKAYQERIERLLIYEDSLFEKGNWKDLRQPGGNRLCNNAWCHGAAGILLSRLQLEKAGFIDKSGMLERDIQYCKQIFLEEKEPDALCLCHGLSGVYMALHQFLREYPDCELEQEKQALGWRLLTRAEKKQISASEKWNMSLMTGLSGIGIALYCAMQNEK